MPRRNSSAEVLPPDEGSLDEHRAFLIKMGEYLDGSRPLNVTEDAVYVVQLPAYHAIEYVDEARNKPYGTLERTPEGFIIAQPSGKQVEVAGSVEEIIDFVSDIRQLTMNKRRQLAMEANREHTRSFTQPGGRKGHLVKEYDELLDQLDALYYRLRDKKKETQ